MPLSQQINRGVLAFLFGKSTGELTATELTTNLFIGLSSTLPTVTGGNITAPTSGDYARQSVARVAGFGDPTDATPSIISNTGLLQFPLSTEAWDAGASWTHVTVHTLVSAGVFWGFSVLPQAQAITAAGQRIQIPIGDLDFTQT